MGYRAILIDADDTLFDFRAAERSAIGEVLSALDVDDPGAPERYSRINRACWADYERGLITQARLKLRRFEELILAYGLDGADPAAVCARYEGALARQSILIDGALDAVRRVAAQLPIAIVTNGIAAVQRARIARSPLRAHLSALVISEEVGAAKPDPAMIGAALRALGAGPEGALMVGDSLGSDVRCAMNAGVDACWYNPAGLERPLGLPIRHEIRDIRALPDVALLP